MSLYIVDIHGSIEGDYEIIRKYDEPKTGKWLRLIYITERGIRIPYYQCSECGKEIDNCAYNYCPRCGTFMKGEQC